MESTEKINLSCRINELPDVILYHVLSFLDMKQVVKTSLVSTRWRYLWIHVQTLNFDYSLWDNRHAMHNLFLEYVFLLRGGSSVKKFSFTSSSVSIDKLNIWLTMLSRKHIPQVSLAISSSLNVTTELLSLFFTSTVEVVQIKSTLARPIGAVNHNIQLPNAICCAPHLKTLNLNSIRLPKGDSNREVNLECSVMEKLILEDCYYAHLTGFNISMPTLKVLTVKNTAREQVKTVGSCKIRISSPNLTKIWLKCCSFENYVIVKCDSLEGAKIEFAFGTLLGDERKTSLGCLKKASRLELSDWRHELCLELQDELDQMPDAFYNLRCLKLMKWRQTALASLLTRSPNIEYLVLELIKEKSNTSTAEVLGDLPSFGDRLKSVEILKFTGCQVEMKLVESVLKNSICLEELIITVHASRSSKAELTGYMRKIHALHRVSSQLLICILPP